MILSFAKPHRMISPVGDKVYTLIYV